jgi:hypothetical protein
MDTKILIAHNAYQQRGGEDMLFEQEIRHANRDGIQCAAVHGAYRSYSWAHWQDRRGAGRNSGRMWSISTIFLDPFSCIPWELWHGAALTPHKYRLMCAGGMLLRAVPCEDCVAQSGLSGVMHGCNRGSAVGSALVLGMGI